MSDYDYDFYISKLEKKIGKKRKDHSLRVYDMAAKINKRDIPDEKIKKAAYFHDCAKYNEKEYFEKYKGKYKLDPEILSFGPVLHAFLGAIVAKEEYNIKDEDILGAIRYHTTGKPNMTRLEKIIFLADATEEKRNYDGVDQIRTLQFEDLDKAIIKSIDGTIKFLISKNAPIYPLTIDTRNYLLREKDE